MEQGWGKNKAGYNCGLEIGDSLLHRQHGRDIVKEQAFWSPMTYNLFIDDERMPPAGKEWLVARSSLEAIAIVKEMGLPAYISFDHDLGGEDLDTSMRFLHWLTTHMLESDARFPEGFDYYVHSQNPIGKANIEGLLKSFMSSIR